MKSLAISINGRVQGVGFRHHTMKVANEYNIKGMVKNMLDGSVYIEASGTDEEIEKFLRYCNEGPRWAVVEAVEILEIKDKGYTGFMVH
ncbi:MAG: acylphosphatase [Bacteroidales bacterium]|nr:acylphosphatase [Bacteroidales bacterium]